MTEERPWFGLYCGMTKDIRQSLGRIPKDVLVELCSFANHLGVCWPGYRRLGDDSGYAVETIHEGIKTLMDAAIIRVHQRYSAVKDEWEFEAYQISPQVIAIQPKYRDDAEKLWNTNFRNDLVTKESQPPPESPQAITTIELLPKPTTTTHSQFPLKVVDGINAPTVENANAKTRANANAEKGKTAHKRKTPAATPQSSDPSPVPLIPSPHGEKLVCYDTTLEDDLAESLAIRMNAETRYTMSLAVARGLIVKHGTARCEASLIHMTRQTNIRQPAAYLRSTIEQRRVDPVQDAKIGVENPASEYISGKYAAYIKSSPDYESTGHANQTGNQSNLERG